MELEELKRRLLAFARAKYDDPGVSVSRVHLMPGHAGFSYGFTVVTGTREESFFLRVPPPNVKWRGMADVLRQVAVLNALDGTDIPHCSVKWCGATSSGSDAPTSSYRRWRATSPLLVLRLAAGLGLCPMSRPVCQRSEGGQKAASLRRQAISGMTIVCDDSRLPKLCQPLVQDAGRHGIAMSP
jgi:hypothetical protein